jgi:DNA-binding NarL/FixJ family response regulator
MELRWHVVDGPVEHRDRCDVSAVRRALWARFVSASHEGVTRVVVADDDETMRRAMVDVLEAHGGFRVVAECVSGVGLPELVAETDAQLVVLDVRMPSGGPSAARTLRDRPPHPVVVAVSASDDVPTVAAMVRAGATGFLAKGDLGATFAEDLVRCMRGQVMIAVAQGAQVLRAVREGHEPFG